MRHSITTTMWPIAGFAAVLVLASCGGGSSTNGSATPSIASSTAGTQKLSAAPPAELGTIKESGFGQTREYVWATAIVRNNSTFVGQTVTVNFNVLDADGAILASEAQVESFSRPKSDHVMGTQISLDGGSKAAKVEASLSVEATGAFSDQPFPTVRTSDYRIDIDEYGTPRLTFEVVNPLPEPLKSPRIGIVCRDAAGKIIGGASNYPDLVPVGGRIRVRSTVMVSGKPAKCSADVAAPTGWEGSGAATAAATGGQEQASTGTAQAAFKTWVNQFTASDWDGQYENLLSAQQKLISKARYKACRASSSPSIKWVKVLSIQDAGPTVVPGTRLKLRSTKVTAQVTVNGIKSPVDAHMFDEGGKWRWTMTQENLDGCS